MQRWNAQTKTTSMPNKQQMLHTRTRTLAKLIWYGKAQNNCLMGFHWCDMLLCCETVENVQQCGIKYIPHYKYSVNNDDDTQPPNENTLFEAFQTRWRCTCVFCKSVLDTWAQATDGWRKVVEGEIAELTFLSRQISPAFHVARLCAVFIAHAPHFDLRKMCVMLVDNRTVSLRVCATVKRYQRLPVAW